MMTTLKRGCTGPEVVKLQYALSLLPDGIFGPLTEEAVKHFQAQHSLAVDGIAGPRTLTALGLRQSPRHITEIIVHCTATREGHDYTVDQIRQWHLQRGFADIGYHYVIYRDGSIHAGRPEGIIGAHCTGHNSCSIGVCYVGGEADDPSHTPKDTRTPQQKAALRSLVARLLEKYPGATVHGHYEFANKACPSFKICDL